MKSYRYTERHQKLRDEKLRCIRHSILSGHDIYQRRVPILFDDSLREFIVTDITLLEHLSSFYKAFCLFHELGQIERSCTKEDATERKRKAIITSAAESGTPGTDAFRWMIKNPTRIEEVQRRHSRLLHTLHRDYCDGTCFGT